MLVEIESKNDLTHTCHTQLWLSTHYMTFLQITVADFVFLPHYLHYCIKVSKLMILSYYRWSYYTHRSFFSWITSIIWGHKCLLTPQMSCCFCQSKPGTFYITVKLCCSWLQWLTKSIYYPTSSEFQLLLVCAPSFAGNCFKYSGVSWN